MVVKFTPRAERQLLASTRWWRANRPAARFLLDDELTAALQMIVEHPSSGVAVRERAGVRRILLVRCEHHVLYRVRPRARRIEIVAFWYAGRGAAPP
jgi:plasmid stabilization system protein ParE